MQQPHLPDSTADPAAADQPRYVLNLEAFPRAFDVGVTGVVLRMR